MAVAGDGVGQTAAPADQDDDRRSTSRIIDGGRAGPIPAGGAPFYDGILFLVADAAEGPHAHFGICDCPD